MGNKTPHREPVTLDARVRIPEGVMGQRVGEEVVLLNLENGVYYGLDPVGSRIWHLLAQGGALRSAFQTVLEEYEVTPGQLEADVLSLVEELEEHGLVEVLE